MHYDDKTLKYYDKIKNIGSFDKSLEDHIGTGIVGSPLCGDVMKLQILFGEGDIIQDAKCKVFGCVSAIASMEYTCDALKGKTIEEAKQLTNDEVSDSLNLTPIKRHCSVLAKEAVHAAIENYIKKKLGVYDRISVTVTPSAKEKIEQLMKENECIGINIDVQNGGCSGVEYYLSYQTASECSKGADHESEDKKCNNHSEGCNEEHLMKSVLVDGINFYYQEQNELLVNGIIIDVVTSDFGYSFIISNPNQGTGSCENCTCKC